MSRSRLDTSLLFSRLPILCTRPRLNHMNSRWFAPGSRFLSPRFFFLLRDFAIFHTRVLTDLVYRESGALVARMCYGEVGKSPCFSRHRVELHLR